MDSLKKISYEIKNQFDNLIVIIAAEISNIPYILVMISNQIIDSKKVDARDIVLELSKYIEGYGGGQSFLSTAGGKNLSGLNSVIKKGKLLVFKILDLK